MTALKPLPDEVEYAWAAGLFEGEGSIIKGKERGALTLSLGMTDEDAVRKFQQAVGFGRVNGPYIKHGKGTKPHWQWCCSTNAAVVILERFLPHLCSRRTARAQELLDLRAEYISWSTQPRSCESCGETFSPEYTKRAQRRRYCSKQCKWREENRRRRAKPSLL